MPRKLQLTFQKGTDGRSGRWKKFYKGKNYYLGAGKSKSDVATYKEALARWEAKKREIDERLRAEARVHESDYSEAIDRWERILRWCVGEADNETADLARQRLSQLREKREEIPQPPVQFRDRVESLYEADPSLVDGLRKAAASISLEAISPDAMFATGIQNTVQQLVSSDGARLVVPTSIQPELSVSSPGLFATEKTRWEDRISQVTNENPSEDSDTVAYWAEQHINRRLNRVNAGELSVGQYRARETALNAFRDWIGHSTSVHSITARTLTQYHSELLGLINAGEYKPNYLRDRIAAAKAFIRWLWENEVIEQLPRNIDSRDLQIARQIGVPEVLEVGEVRSLVTSASERTRLYILLALNTGMTQKGIADLHPSMVDWDSGTLTRKRGKTKRFDSVPTVTYKLWPETFNLLKKYRSDSEDKILLNTNGAPLYQEYMDGKPRKLKKNDNIKNAFERVRRAVKIQKSFGKLRKTSATAIESDPRFRGLDELFLGHAPSSVAKKHYVAPTENALDDALAFLREKYDIEGAIREAETGEDAMGTESGDPETSPA